MNIGIKTLMHMLRDREVEKNATKFLTSENLKNPPAVSPAIRSAIKATIKFYKEQEKSKTQQKKASKPLIKTKESS